MTGSAHDATAFQHTTAAKYPDWFFEGEEFAWTDSAYAINSRTIPVHKKPASLIPENARFDRMVSHLRIRSEHCLGALKGRFQCLRGLRVEISNNEQHVKACRWITIAIILHNLIIDVEGGVDTFESGYNPTQDQENNNPDEPLLDDSEHGEAKRQQLVAELLAFQAL